MTEIKIKSEELETSRRTSDSIFDSKKDSTTNISDDKKIEGEIEKTEKGKNLTPFEISRTKYYNSEKKKNKAQAQFFNAIRYAIYILLGFGAIYGMVWAYKVDNIAEPIGGMKVEIRYIKENFKDTKDQIQKLQDKIDVIEKRI